MYQRFSGQFYIEKIEENELIVLVENVKRKWSIFEYEMTEINERKQMIDKWILSLIEILHNNTNFFNEDEQNDRSKEPEHKIHKRSDMIKYIKYYKFLMNRDEINLKNAFSERELKEKILKEYNRENFIQWISESKPKEDLNNSRSNENSADKLYTDTVLPKIEFLKYVLKDFGKKNNDFISKHFYIYKLARFIVKNEYYKYEIEDQILVIEKLVLYENLK